MGVCASQLFAMWAVVLFLSFSTIVLLSLFEFVPCHIFEPLLLTYALVSETYCLLVSHAFVDRDVHWVLLFAFILLAIFAFPHLFCCAFLFRFALFFA